jgi:UDP:flavonoid glycosyltransferase YjiC (YdhE family)
MFQTRRSPLTMPRFLITALGSYGDVHPMVGLGAALAARGHEVKILTNPYFEDVVRGAGLELVPLGSRAEYERLSRHPHLWRPVRGPKLVLSYASARMLRPLYDLLVANYQPGETVFCAHGMDLASRVAGEKLHAPVASVLFAPGVLWTIHDSPRFKGAFLGPMVPRWLKQAQFWISDALFIKPLLGPQLNALRRELGLAPVRRIFARWLFASDLVLGLFPEWFGPRQPDWPAHARMVGFPLWDTPGSVPIFRSGKMGTDPLAPSRPGKMGTDPLTPSISPSGLPSDVREFLAAGPPPIAFSPGSANHEAHRFFEAAVDACQRLGRRGILLTKYAHQLPARLPLAVRHAGFVPMSQLLPHAAALVHHGGIGSCAQGLAAGLPQVVRAMSYDQFDNSRRLVRLGVAREISVRRFNGPTVANELQSLFDSPTVAARCRDLASRCNGPAALATACDALEELADRTASK